MSLSLEEKQFCEKLGLRLRKARIEHKQTQAELAARTGVTRQTMIEMEKGEPSVSFEKWLKASSALGLMETWKDSLDSPVDPFQEYDKKLQEENRLRKARVRHKK